MEIFYDELKEFFNAVNLDKLLETAIWGKNGNDIDKDLLNRFLELKRDQNVETMVLLDKATQLRQHIQDVVPRLFAHDENKKPIYQGLSLADIQIEKLVFVKLSESVQKALEANDVTKLTQLSQACITHIQLSGTGGQELQAIANELEAFQTSDFSDQTSNRLALLRLKATLERGVRLAQNFSASVSDTFQETVSVVGKSFGVDQPSIDVFSESFIRSHLFFQLAKGLETLLQKARSSLNLPPMTLISQASQVLLTGVLSETSDMYSPNGEIVFLQRADGTEEVPSGVKVVVLKHQLP